MPALARLYQHVTFLQTRYRLFYCRTREHVVKNGLCVADEFIVFEYSINHARIISNVTGIFLLLKIKSCNHYLFSKMFPLSSQTLFAYLSFLVLGTRTSPGAYTKRFLFAPLAVRCTNNTDKLPVFLFGPPFPVRFLSCNGHLFHVFFP